MKRNRRQIFPVAEISRSELACEPLPLYINSPVWLNLTQRRVCLSGKCPSQFHHIIQRGSRPGVQAVTQNSGGIILWRILNPILKMSESFLGHALGMRKENYHDIYLGEVEIGRSKRSKGRDRTMIPGSQVYYRTAHCDVPLLVVRTVEERWKATYLMRFNEVFLLLHSQESHLL